MATDTRAAAPAALKRAYEDHLEARTRPGGGDSRHGRRTFRAMLRASGPLPAMALDDGRPVWVWSDLHLGHDNIIGYTDRPFTSAGQMDETLYANWATTVGPEDTLVFVGDIAMRAAVGEHTWRRIRAWPGAAKLLVFGNHDLTGSGEIRVDGFDAIVPVLCAGGDPPLVFTHMPLASVPAGWVNVHGHTHNEPPRRSRHVNVSVEQLDYRPVALERIRALAGELVAGRYPDGATTLERIGNV